MTKDLANTSLLSLPLLNTTLENKGNGVYCVVSNSEHNTFYVKIKAGFRGSSEIIRINPQPNLIFSFKEYESETGSIGESACAVFSLPVAVKRIEIEARRSGRLYGEPCHFIAVITIKNSKDNNELSMDYEVIPYACYNVLGGLGL